MPLVIASLVSAVIVLVSPFMGQLQSFLRRSLTTRQYVLLFGVGVFAAIGLVVLLAFARIRERRLARLVLLLVALVFGGLYMRVTATPWAEVNAVERVHFVEYGAIAFLFYRAWKPAGDLTMIVLPMLAAFMVGTLDEWLQWFIPYRVGEAHDVFLNLAAIACGLMFAFAVTPPRSFSWRLHAPAIRRLGLGAATVWLVFAAFFSQVHLGHAIDIGGGVQFRSHYSPQELEALQRDRAVRWQTQPPIGIARLSQEDQYLDEALAHVRRRNLADPLEAWKENLILERFYTPVLDSPTYSSKDGHRWPAEQRINVQAQISAGGGAFLSAAEPYPIVTWPRTAFWVAAILMAGLLAGAPYFLAFTAAAKSSY
jgi:VanZ family protein